MELVSGPIPAEHEGAREGRWQERKQLQMSGLDFCFDGR
jgi:hypothetical protein